LEDLGFESGVCKIARDRRFVSSPNVQTNSGAHLASCSVNTMVLLKGINRLEREIDQSRPLVPQLRMNGAVPLLPQYALMAWTGKKL